MRVKRTLSFLVATWTAGAIAVSMGIYAVFQYLSDPRLTVAELFLHHTWHVVVLGIVTYALCRVVMHSVVVRPLELIHAHLYGLGMGRLERLDLVSPVQEIQGIVDHVNLMLCRMEQGFDVRAIETCQVELAELRRLAASGALGSGSGTRGVALQHLRNLEGAVLSVLQAAKSARTSSPQAARLAAD